MSYIMDEAGDLGVDCVRSNPNYDLKNHIDSAESNDNIYRNVEHSCKYYEMGEFLNEFSYEPRKFSTLSLNVRSLPGNWTDFRDLVVGVNNNNHKFSVVAIQEVWNVPPGALFDLPGY